MYQNSQYGAGITLLYLLFFMWGSGLFCHLFSWASAKYVVVLKVADSCKYLWITDVWGSSEPYSFLCFKWGWEGRTCTVDSQEPIRRAVVCGVKSLDLKICSIWEETALLIKLCIRSLFGRTFLRAEKWPCVWVSWDSGFSDIVVSRSEYWRGFCSCKAANLISSCFSCWSFSCGFHACLCLL